MSEYAIDSWVRSFVVVRFVAIDVLGREFGESSHSKITEGRSSVRAKIDWGLMDLQSGNPHLGKATSRGSVERSRLFWAPFCSRLIRAMRVSTVEPRVAISAWGHGLAASHRCTEKVA